MKRKLVFTLQARLERDANGVVRAPVGSARYESWAPYLQVFDEVLVVSRVESSPEASGHVVEGPGVRVVEAPYYRGLGQLIRVMPNLFKFFKTHFNESGFYGGRIPDVLSILLLHQATKNDGRFLAQVVADPAEVLRSGVTGRLGRAASPLVATMFRRSIKKANAVIYVTRSTLQKLYPSSTKAIVLSRSNVELPQEALSSAPRDYIQDPIKGPLHIVTAGTQEQNYKGHDILIRAVRRLHEQGVQVQATIIGDGKLRSTLVELAERLQVSHAVGFVDRLPSPAHVREFISAADLFVLPSRTEGLPRVLIEAMARGIACLGAEVGGVPELIDKEWRFRSDDPKALAEVIRAVIASPHKLTEGARKQWVTAHEIANHYSGDRVLTDFLRKWVNLTDQSTPR